MVAFRNDPARLRNKPKILCPFVYIVNILPITCTCTSNKRRLIRFRNGMHF